LASTGRWQMTAALRGPGHGGADRRGAQWDQDRPRQPYEMIQVLFS
jgi:hypothetical protein